MGNLQKITKAQVSGGIVEEIERTPETERKFNHETHNIDSERTHLNYSLTNRDISAIEYLNQRLKEVKCQNRADVKVVGAWVWTVPKDLAPEYHKDFFQGVYDYYAEKHGTENIAYAQVHLDETTPHLHIGIIPTVYDKKKERYKVCAKEVFTKEYMQHAHTDLQLYLEERLGVEVNLLNGESLGIDGIKDFKAAKDLTKQVAFLDQEIIEKKEIIKKLDKEIFEKKGILQDLTEKAEILKERIEETIAHFRSHPNMFQMFLHWATKGRYSIREEKDILDEYEAHLERSRHIHRGISR